VFAMQLSLAEVKQQVHALQTHGADVTYGLFGTRSWQGEPFAVNLKVVSTPAPAADVTAGEGATGSQPAAAAASSSSCKPFTVGIYVGPVVREAHLLGLISFSVTLMAVQQPAPAQPWPPNQARGVVQPPAPEHLVMAMTRKGFGALKWGWRDFLGCGAVDSWDAFEAHLRASKLVHPGDCLQIKVEITELL
jgi:hypothetical protein